MLLKGSYAIVTGSNKGIGEAIVESFVKHGANVWACARRPDSEFEGRLAHLELNSGLMVRPIYFDLSSESEIKEGMLRIQQTRLPVNILVNNAGMIGEIRSFQMTPIPAMREVFQANFFGPMLLIQYVSRQMMRGVGGSIINVASIAGLDGDPGQLEYVSSKGSLIAATKKLASELWPCGIRVNAVAPGVTLTEMGARMSAELMEETLSRSIMRRAGKPSEIASVIAFLASSLSTYMTGQIIRVDGGKR